MESQIKNQECQLGAPPINGFDCLPREIILDIASRLSASSVIRLRCVCKSFYSFLRGTEFVNLHLSRSVNNDPCIVFHASLNKLRFLEYAGEPRVEVQMMTNPHFRSSLPKFRVVGSCEGLLCIFENMHSEVAFVYNPFTWDYIELPKSLLETQVQYFVYGFGIHPSTKEYKVIKIMHYDYENPKRPDVQVLSVGSNKWRSIGEVGYYIDPISKGITLNGKVHWLTQFAVYYGDYDRLIVSFDLADEVFVEIPKVDFVRPISHLVVLGGYLAAARTLRQVNGGILEIWVMREYNVKESWVKEFVIGAYTPAPDSFIPYLPSPEVVLCMLKNGELLLEYEDGNLVSYNPQNGVFRKLTSMAKSLVVHVGGLNWIDIPPPDL